MKQTNDILKQAIENLEESKFTYAVFCDLMKKWYKQITEEQPQ